MMDRIGSERKIFALTTTLGFDPFRVGIIMRLNRGLRAKPLAHGYLLSFFQDDVRTK
ncbi:MAG TPA: hypothetical protein VIX17_05420 [Pyrinomonadaceae bacterium]|jgi:hypothetical protein